MRVRDIMKRHPRVARLTESLETAGRAMSEVGCGVLPVLDENEVVVGVVTDRDICLALATRDSKPSALTVDAVMRRPVYTSGPDATIAAALATMRERRVRRLPVVSEGGEIQGLLCLDDVAREVVELAGEEPGRPAYADVAETLAAINSPPALSAAVWQCRIGDEEHEPGREPGLRQPARGGDMIVLCSVCEKEIEEAEALSFEFQGGRYRLCSRACLSEIEANPEPYAEEGVFEETY